MVERVAEKGVNGSRLYRPLSLALLLVFGIECAAFAILLRRIARQKRPPEGEAVATEATLSTPDRGREVPTVASPRIAARRPDISDATPASSSLRESARDILTQLRISLDGRAMPDAVPEARINAMDDYLLGVITALRATNPQAFHALADQFVDEICSGQRKSDLDLLLFARMATLQSDIGSVRALSCSLDGRSKEDPVLWSVLRAWNVAGRPPIPAVASISSWATDGRTQHLLLPPDEAREIERAEANQATEAVRKMRALVGATPPTDRQRSN
jgi:hypothetical protein